MRLKIIDSGSKGNGYVLENNEEILLIEAGVKGKEILQAINYEVGKVVGCIVSHEHGDHAKYISDYMKYGINVYASDEVAKDIEIIYGEKVSQMRRKKKHEIGGFTIMSFSVPHNETECDGFLILHDEIDSLLFITDAEYCRYDFSKFKVSHIMVECNYSMDYVKHDYSNLEHILKGHMELETCKRFVKTNSSQYLRSVGLLHLSNENADTRRFVRETKQIVDSDVNVYVADKWFETELILEPF